jgi:molecular chaperone GrpE
VTQSNEHDVSEQLVDEIEPVEGAVEEEAPEPVEEAVEEEAPAPDPLAEVTRERDVYLDALQRLKAEFDNYRKRAAREQQDIVSRAAERLVKELLPVLDDLERALAAVDQHEEAKLEEGVRLVQRALADVLEREGLAEIETNGKFDPHIHEALLAQPADDVESGGVVQVLQKGYRLGDKVLRPARVIIAE